MNFKITYLLILVALIFMSTNCLKVYTLNFGDGLKINSIIQPISSTTDSIEIKIITELTKNKLNKKYFNPHFQISFSYKYVYFDTKIDKLNSQEIEIGAATFNFKKKKISLVWKKL